MEITPVHPHFGARVESVDLTRPLDDATFARIREAFEEHSVLVFLTSASPTSSSSRSASGSARSRRRSGTSPATTGSTRTWSTSPTWTATAATG